MVNRKISPDNCAYFDIDNEALTMEAGVLVVKKRDHISETITVPI